MEAKEPERRLNINFREFLSNRIYLVVTVAILVVAIAGGIYAILALRSDVAGQDAGAQNTEFAPANPEISEVAEVLPQQRREVNDTSDSASWNAFEPALDPFADPMRLTGIVTGGRGGSMAIIESSGTSYIVSVGDYVDDLWAVRDITGSMVIMRAYNQEVYLYLDQPPETRSLTGGFEEEETEDEQEEGA